MKKNFLLIVILSGLLMVFSCNQDPIFYTISTETKPIPPHIPGAPTNMVVFNRHGVPVMYVASDKLYWYAKKGGTGDSGWEWPEYSIPQPGGKITGLAVTSNGTSEYLYALSISASGATTTLRRIGKTENDWKEITANDSKYTLIQSIHADGNQLFAGAMNNKDSDFGILYLDSTPNPALQLLVSDTEMLSGAALLNNNFYLSTRGKGVYSIPENSLSPGSVTPLTDHENPDRLFMGMIKLKEDPNDPSKDKIIVIERNGGTLYEVNQNGFRQIKYSDGTTVATGKFATGSMAVWQNSSGSEKMFLAGIQGGLYSSSSSSSYTHGYAEFELNFQTTPASGIWLVLNSTRRDTTPNITVDHQTDRYTATIGKHPINHMFQATSNIDTNMTFFASTQTAGLWSYRERSEGPQWNAEK